MQTTALCLIVDPMEQVLPGRKLIRAYDVGRILGYSTSTIKRWAKRGQLPAVFLGRHIRFDPDEIENFIRNGGQRPGPATIESTVRKERSRAIASDSKRPEVFCGTCQSKSKPSRHPAST